MEAFLAGVFRVPPRGGVPGPRGAPLSGIPLFHGRRRRRPSSSVVCMAEPYLIAKLDSAEKASKEMSPLVPYFSSVRLADPDIVSDPSKYQKLAQSVSELDQVVTTYRQFKDCERMLEETKGSFVRKECSLARKLQKPIDDDKYKDADDCSELHSIANQKPRNDTCQSADVDAKARRLGRSSSDINNHQDTRITTLIRRNMALEEQLSAAPTSKDEAEKNLSLVIDSKDDLEKRLAEKDREVEALKEKATGLELAQEESHNISNTVHADNVRLEREVAFLKAVMDETQKELHSTRGVLAGECARAFQFQVEVFHLKQHLQTMEGRSPTPRKPQNM